MANLSKKRIIDFVTHYEQRNEIDKRAYNSSLRVSKVHKSHTNFEEVFIKVNFVNGAFKTVIWDTKKLAIKISEIKGLHSLIKNGDVNAVNKIAFALGKRRKFYSFATKYCHIHNSEAFPIYDSLVVKGLQHYKKELGLRFTNSDLKDYAVFKDVIDQFKIKIDGKDLKNKIVDRFLWVRGKQLKQK